MAPCLQPSYCGGNTGSVILRPLDRQCGVASGLLAGGVENRTCVRERYKWKNTNERQKGSSKNFVILDLHWKFQYEFLM